ncbi:glucose-6-phosphate isomerase [Jannaschia seohaensis]|uniref:Glucose-6-phosphate isomerase n=1 Tax=Jannaschia seohaensis TaxID=475081 RepID=A0A2Y9AVP5_9RHOB|nr:glucose-6-phosphate isomerase [Jannaschia seohaensis]PWJ18073.1 glucose-6-phosphate isomerase [Jannaschia seohaensis]SSA46597.1 glucose-6-phosphate isomerase [Jannaschia seohaensis]
MEFWTGIESLRSQTGGDIADLLADEARNARLRARHGAMMFDASKTSIPTAALDTLLEMAAGVPARRDAMFDGAAINETEGRAVLHTALRGTRPVMVDGADVMPEVQDTLARMRDFARAVRDGSFAPNGRITDVVNIGIGGSDLGPAMATIALAPFHDGPRCHFVSNVDGADWADTAKGLDPKTTLVIVASKTFTTIETLTNAKTAKAWMGEAVADPAAQFAALSTAQDKTSAFGIDLSRVFGFADWVGGRYSMWGPIGLSLMIAIGPDAFDAFLGGARSMDDHFRTADLAENMPVLLALIGIWHHQVCGYPTRAVLPYDNRLARLPAYLQQLEMESNGKGVTMDGATLPGPAGPVVWGEPGTNGQHAFYQLIHQGRTPVPCEFMVAAKGHEPALDNHHKLLMANCLAQSEALLRGRSLDEAREKVAGKFEGAELERQAAHRVFEGNRPSTTLIYPQLDPATLGAIVALYEHRVFVEGVMLGINSFDQWGVELGKELATSLGPLVDGADASGKDASTQALLAQLLAWRD